MKKMTKSSFVYNWHIGAQKPTVWDSVISGLGSTARVFEVKRYEYPHTSVNAALREDWMRVGQDFRKAIERAYVGKNREPT